MLIRDPNTGTYTSILNATTKKIKSDWIENFSVDTLTTGIESDGDYNYFIDISGRKIIFNKRVGSSDIVVGQISARYSSASGEFLTIAPADSFEISNPNSNTPYLLAEGSGMELVGKDSNTAQILINTNDDGEIKILGDLYVNGVPYGVAVFG